MTAAVSTTRIVLVDDDPLIAEIAREALEQARYEVVVATHGDDAIDAIWDAVPDLVLLDWALPGRAGSTLLRELRASPMFAGTPVLMITSKRSIAFEAMARDAGADGYVRKPFVPHELVATVALALRTAGNRRAAVA